jgi:hypothetical protein
MQPNAAAERRQKKGPIATPWWRSGNVHVQRTLLSATVKENYVIDSRADAGGPLGHERGRLVRVDAPR